jgi:thiosulfate/3-mercaptopyruvate sulfurtransferase
MLDSRYGEDFDHHHIPGSVNLHFKRLLNKNKTLKSPEELTKIFTEVGVEKDKKVIVTC